MDQQSGGHVCIGFTFALGAECPTPANDPAASATTATTTAATERLELLARFMCLTSFHRCGRASEGPLTRLSWPANAWLTTFAITRSTLPPGRERLISVVGGFGAEVLRACD